MRIIKIRDVVLKDNIVVLGPGLGLGAQILVNILD